MKNLKHLFTALLLLCTTMAFAEEVTIDGIKYDIITKGKVATVKNSSYSGDIVIPATVEHNGVTCSVTSIGEDAFYGCYGLTSITIPNSVTSIGDDAFQYCSGLTSIIIPNSVTSIGDDAFYYCSGLTSVTIGNGVTSIGDKAFYNCSDLTSVTIGNSVTSIGDYAFYYCSALTSITIPDSVTSIGEDAFCGCYGLTSITIPNSVTSIGDDAFQYCSGLTSIIIPNSVTSIGERAFYGCSGLTSVTIPNSVISIGDYAFENCSGLTNITIPNSVTSIGNYAFSGCTSLKELRIEDGEAELSLGYNFYNYSSLGEGLFYDCPLETLHLGRDLNYNTNSSYGYSPFYNKRTLTSVTIGNSVTSIGNYAFQNCSDLKSVTIGNNVTSIGRYAFNGCSGLTSIEIPNGVTSIGWYAFSGCSDLKSVTIGNGVTSIGDYAFYNCENLADVYCLAINVPTTYGGAFYESYPEYMILHVPAEALNDYKATAPWSSIGTIVALDGEEIEPEVPEVPEIKVCATPVISYNNYKLVIECETEGAEFVTKVTSEDFKTFYDTQIDFSVAYNISVYAMATGYENSETVNAVLCWVEDGDADDDNGIIKIPVTAVLITSNNGVLYINCTLEDEVVEVYTIDGVFIETATIENGNAIVQTGLSKGSVAIMKIGNKSVKVIVD